MKSVSMGKEETHLQLGTLTQACVKSVPVERELAYARRLGIVYAPQMHR